MENTFQLIFEIRQSLAMWKTRQAGLEGVADRLKSKSAESVGKRPGSTALR